MSHDRHDRHDWIEFDTRFDLGAGIIWWLPLLFGIPLLLLLIMVCR